MCTNNSPLETLAAFVIVYAAGVLSTLLLTRYIDSIKHAAQKVEPTTPV